MNMNENSIIKCMIVDEVEEEESDMTIEVDVQ